jgi:hypothetical protein
MRAVLLKLNRSPILHKTNRKRIPLKFSLTLNRILILIQLQRKISPKLQTRPRREWPASA